MASKTEKAAVPPDFNELTIIAQDPSVRAGSRILTAKVKVPAEELAPGPCGYRVHVIDYDAATNTLYKPAILKTDKHGRLHDPFGKKSSSSNKKLLNDPRFHSQNVYAIIMRTLGHFEFALGRRIPWGSDGHQLHIAPHATADVNAFYAREHRAIFFGYFTGKNGRPVYTSLSHDVVAHETTHAILDGLRGRYLEPSSPDQDGFHEGFADVIALLSVFALPEIVGALLGPGGERRKKTVSSKSLTAQELRDGVLLGMAEEMGKEDPDSGPRARVLRRSVTLKPGLPYRRMKSFQEAHDRGELLVAAMMNAFIHLWVARLKLRGEVAKGRKDRAGVVEDGCKVAGHLLTMAIRAIDYCPPTDINFSDYLSALLTVDSEIVPDDSRYGYRSVLLDNFAKYDIRPATPGNGTWRAFSQELRYSRVHFNSMLRDKEEVFRFIWENRVALNIDERGYVEVESVSPSKRVAPDGFILNETVAEYVQIMTLRAGELKSVLGIEPPADMPSTLRLRIFGGGTLIFDDYGRLKYQVSNRLTAKDRQEARLRYLWENGYLENPVDANSHFAALHLKRALRR